MTCARRPGCIELPIIDFFIALPGPAREAKKKRFASYFRIQGMLKMIVKEEIVRGYILWYVSLGDVQLLWHVSRFVGYRLLSCFGSTRW